MHEETFSLFCRYVSYSIIPYIVYIYILMYFFFLSFFIVSRLVPSLSFHFLSQFLPFLLAKQVLSCVPCKWLSFWAAIMNSEFICSLTQF